MISSVTVLTLAPLMGIIGDKVPITVLYPVAFSLRAVTAYLFLVTNTPESPFASSLVILIDVFSMMEAISYAVVFYRLVPRELRGIMLAGLSVTGQIGKMLFTLVGGPMFDLLGRNAPQVFMGVMDTMAVLLAIVFIKQGKL